MINPINAKELTASVQRDYLKEARIARISANDKKETPSVSQPRRWQFVRWLLR